MQEGFPGNETFREKNAKIFVCFSQFFFVKFRAILLWDMILRKVYDWSEFFKICLQNFKNLHKKYPKIREPFFAIIL